MVWNVTMHTPHILITLFSTENNIDFNRRLAFTRENQAINNLISFTMSFFHLFSKACEYWYWEDYFIYSILLAIANYLLMSILHLGALWLFNDVLSNFTGQPLRLRTLVWWVEAAEINYLTCTWYLEYAYSTGALPNYTFTVLYRWSCHL